MTELYFKFKGSILKGSMRPGDPGKLDFNLPFALKDEFKETVSKARWNPGTKCWSADDNFRTRFILDYLQGKDVYARYDKPLIETEFNRKVLYEHQKLIVRHVLTRQYAMIAAEMGTGKTLSIIEAFEAAQKLNGTSRWWYCAPKSALESVKYDFRKWNAQVMPQFMTYEEMVRILSGWSADMAPPEGVVFDESSRLKTESAQRTQAALHLADNIREYHGDRGYVVLMSGSPAPKSPVDWFSQLEIACPGFIREGSAVQFQKRIALMAMVENSGGIKYPKLLAYRDSTNKCNICGKLEDSEFHKTDVFTQMTFVGAGQNAWEQPHAFIPMTDEISILHKRMTGLALVIFKRDCLTLPEKVYQIRELKPTPTMMRLAKMVKTSAPTAAQAIILLRELSDGFQYSEKLVGTFDCEFCKGTGKETYELDGGPLQPNPCRHGCQKGKRKQYESVTVECDTPKTQELANILEDKEEDGRIIIYAGFTGSIDRVTATVVSQRSKKWNWIRVDGRGWTSDLGTNDPQKLIRIFQEEREQYPNVAFIGHPGSAGMGLTLTASDTIVYYSNDFNAESRSQSEDRVHRPGSRGANIIDLCHLPIDKLVIDNLKKKRDMMKVTMGDLDKIMEEG